jgi:regulator of protease activity HflC (stomatin/prohibitin superfamily)
MGRHEMIIKDTHRGLYYEDGILTQVLGAGRHALPRHIDLWFYRTPKIEVILVDVRERELTIKGQEILTADKVAIRVSIIVQFRVTDPKAALHEVENYQERLYGDVQLAARRSLASMTLEEILTDRNRLSEDILRDVYKVAGNYGVTISRAEIKDLIFPGNLQEIMNKVLAAERTSQAQLVEARTRADVQRIAAAAEAEAKHVQSEALASSVRRGAEADAEATRIKVDADVVALRTREQAAGAYSRYPALLRLTELEALAKLAGSANASLDRRAPMNLGSLDRPARQSTIPAGCGWLSIWARTGSFTVSRTPHQSALIFAAIATNAATTRQETASTEPRSASAIVRSVKNGLTTSMSCGVGTRDRKWTTSAATIKSRFAKTRMAST